IALAILGIVDLTCKAAFGCRLEAHDELVAEQRAGALVGIGIFAIAERLATLVRRGLHPDDEAADAVAAQTAALEPDAGAAVLGEPGAGGIGWAHRPGAAVEDHQRDGDRDADDDAKKDIHLSCLSRFSSVGP